MVTSAETRESSDNQAKSRAKTNSVPKPSAVVLKQKRGENSSSDSTEAAAEPPARGTHPSKSSSSGSTIAATEAATEVAADPVQDRRTGIVSNRVLLSGGVSVLVSGSKYRGSGIAGDFGWMITRTDRTLFIFNDNEEQFNAFMSGDRESGCAVGGGNAVIRPYQCTQPIPRAAGVPTGLRHSGYQALDGRTKEKIDSAVARIRALAETGKYDSILMSQGRGANGQPTIGASIFSPAEEVRDYVFQSLLRLEPYEG